MMSKTMKSENSIRLIIADDHQVIIKGIQLLIQNEFPVNKIHECSNIENLEREIELFQPTHIILDVSFPEDSSIHYLESIFTLMPSVKILLFTMHPESLFQNVMLKYPALLFCQKSENEYLLLSKLQTFFYQKINDKGNKFTITPKNKSQLSRKEETVAQMLIEGKSTTEIANFLNVRSNTISTYKRRIFDKTEATNILELAKIFK